MLSRLSVLVALAACLALALPAAAGARHGRGQAPRAAQLCRALDAGGAPAALPADRVDAAKAACAKLKDAVSAARADYVAAVTPIMQNVSAARDAAEVACLGVLEGTALVDLPAVQDCQAKRRDLRAAGRAARPGLRAARGVYRDALHAALAAFRAALAPPTSA